MTTETAKHLIQATGTLLEALHQSLPTLDDEGDRKTQRVVEQRIQVLTGDLTSWVQEYDLLGWFNEEFGESSLSELFS